ncbi:MAG: acetyl-CoA carboxylase carboxyl transferase subunit beta, partial [Deltaproteobacteria bacterium]
MAWFSKNRVSVDASEKKTIGQGVFRRCDECGVTLRAEEFTENHEVCPSCNHHYPLSAESWPELVL